MPEPMYDIFKKVLCDFCCLVTVDLLLLNVTSLSNLDVEFIITTISAMPPRSRKLQKMCLYNYIQTVDSSFSTNQLRVHKSKETI